MTPHRRLVIAALLPVLGQMPAPAPADELAAAEPHRGGELVLTTGGITPTLSPALSASPLVTVPGAQLFASLFRLDADLEPQPYLARQRHLSDDGLTLTVELEPSARFHDGRPITSRDVAFSIRAVRDQHSFPSMLAAVERVDTPSPHTAVIRLRHPHPALFMALSVPLTPILPAHVYGRVPEWDGRSESWKEAAGPIEVPDLRGHPANRAPVGSGPFRFERWTEDGDLELSRFDGFFLKGRPLLDRLIFRKLPEIDQVPLALAAGEVQLGILLDQTNARNLAAQHPELVVIADGDGGLRPLLFGLTFNLRRPPFDDRRVRQAIAAALDLEHLGATLFPGSAKLVTGPFPPDHPFALDRDTLITGDIARASRLLDQAGRPRGADGLRFTATYINGLDEKVFIAFGDYLRWHLGHRLGIDIEVVNTRDLREWLTRMAAGDFDLALDTRFIWGDPVIGLHRIYQSGAIRPDGLFTNYAGYADPDVDALLEAAGQALDPQRRAALYRRFQAHIAHDLPYLWICVPLRRSVRHRDLVFPTDSPWAIAQPYDQVHWRSPGSAGGAAASPHGAD